MPRQITANNFAVNSRLLRLQRPETTRHNLTIRTHHIVATTWSHVKWFHEFVANRNGAESTAPANHPIIKAEQAAGVAQAACSFFFIQVSLAAYCGQSGAHAPPCSAVQPPLKQL